MTDTDTYRDELIGWRLYYVHRGRLCSPMVGSLAPIASDEGAVCRHEDHPPPAVGCWCGWRLADNVAALRPAAEAASNPVGMLPAREKLASEHKPDGSTVWGWPLPVLQRWDWPMPALVQVRGYAGVRAADDVTANLEDLRAQAARSRVSLQRAQVRRVNVIEEGAGMWRAARIEIIGPVITAPTGDPVVDSKFHPRDMARHYGVGHHHLSRRTWLEAVDLVDQAPEELGLSRPAATHVAEKASHR